MNSMTIFFIQIDCPPGPIRPIHILKWACENTKIPIPKGVHSGRLFGNWGFYVELSEECMEKLWKSIKVFYPGHIRYADYGIEEKMPEDGSPIYEVLKEYNL